MRPKPARLWIRFALLPPRNTETHDVHDVKSRPKGGFCICEENCGLLGADRRKNFLGHFFGGQRELEHRCLRSTAPAIHLPSRAEKLDLRLRSEIKQQRMLAAI